MPRTKRSEIKLSFLDGDMQVSVFWPPGGNIEEMANVVGLLNVGAFLGDIMEQVIKKAKENGQEDILDEVAEIVDTYLLQDEEIKKHGQNGPIVQPLHLTQHLMAMGGRVE